MFRKFFRVAFAITCVSASYFDVRSAKAVDLCGVFCRTPDVVPGEEYRYQTQFFAGLQWRLGETTPTLDFGVRRSRTNDGDDTTGAKLDLALKIDSEFWKDPTLRLMALAGKRDAQGEFGLGLSGLDFKPLIAAGVQGPYVEGGANFIFGTGLQPYLTVSSLAAPARTRGPVLTCPPGYKLVRVLFPSEHSIDGKECDLDLLAGH